MKELSLEQKVQIVFVQLSFNCKGIKRWLFSAIWS